MIDQTNTVFRFDEFALDTDRSLLLRRGEVVPLKAKAFELLLTLVESRGEVISKNELLDRVWENQFVEENNLTVHVAALRKALGEKKNENRYIVTVPGKGYRFVGSTAMPANGEVLIESRKFQKIVVSEELEEESFDQPDDELRIDSVSAHALQKPRSVSPGIAVSAIILAIGAALAGYAIWQKRPADTLPAFHDAGVRRLTNHGRANVAVISPDGKTVAYSQTQPGTSGSELRLVLTNGMSDTSLVPAGSAQMSPTAFSADSQWLYYVVSEPGERDSRTLYKIPVLGGVPQKLLSRVNSISSLSPDETQIAFVRTDPKTEISELIVASVEGSGERVLIKRSADQPIRGFSPSWSPDSKLIAFGAGTGHRAGYSASGGEADLSELFVAQVSDGSVSQITTLDWNEVAKVDWLKDGSGLLAVARDKNSFAAAQIWHIDYPQGTARKVVNDLSHYGSALSVSKDSKRAVAAQINRDSSIWIAPADELENAKQITSGGLFRQDGWYGLDWVRQERVIFSARIDHSLALWTMNADGSDRRQITPPGAQDRTPSASPDGQFIVFESNRSGRGEIWRVGADGSGLTQLTRDGGSSDPSITPDGQWVVYRNSGGGGDNLRKVTAVGGEPVTISDQECLSPRVAPDGKSIACGRTSHGKNQITLLSLDHGQPLKTFDVPKTFNFDMGAIRWSPDGRYIDYRDWYNGVWRQSTDGGDPHRIEGLPGEKLYQFVWSVDGNHLAFTRGRAMRDIVLLEAN
jgi:Tol biopolymer transport system component/DNA-binding winged helix-turn-helix (wHTH) protein